MAAARADLRALPLFKVPSPVHCEFCRVMDVLSDWDWTRFASAVLEDQTTLRQAEKQERRTDWLMLEWQSRNGSVGQLLDLLEKLELWRPRDIINNWASSVPPPAVPPLPSVSAQRFNPPQNAPPMAPPSVQPTCPLSKSKIAMLPKPKPPELISVDQSSVETLPQPLSDAAAAASLGMCTSGVMAWAYEEVYSGTCGFCDALKVGEGGFGEVFRATLRNTDCAVKKFKQDCSLDQSWLRDSFQTEVEKLSKFRHPNIVDLLGYSDGGGTLCLIYSFMKNNSLDDQLHSDDLGLSWCQRVSIVKGAANALQYLHCPPVGQMPLVHGDVKSSNILLDHHLEAKLADFGLARFSSRRSSDHTATQTFGTTQMVRGTLAYLPEEYIRDGKLKTVVDVYGFGVVLLEILTGRSALEKDKKTGQDIYLKELVNDVEDNEAQWRRQLDKRLVSRGDAEPTGFMQVASLARRCLDKWKKRPSMTEVYKVLHDLYSSLNPSTSSSSSLPSVLDPSATSAPHPKPPRSLDFFSALTLNSVAPSEPTYCPKASSLSPPQTLHSSRVTPTYAPHRSPSPSLLHPSFDEPCETDESRGYSQYNVRSSGLGPSRSGSDLNRFTQPSVPTEDQYNFPPNSEVMGRIVNQAAAPPECTSPAGSLQSLSPVVLNPSKQRLLEKKALYDQGLIQTPELLSTDYLVRSPAGSRLPEESDELEYLTSKTQ